MATQKLTFQMIEAFRAVVMKGGIGAAADSLGASQPAMSRTISELQRVVGFQLFAKHGRTVKPTDEALALMAKVQQSFQGLEDIARFSEQLRKQRMGRLSICAIPALGNSIMPDAIAFIRRKHADVVVSLDVVTSIEAAHRVHNRQADIGFGAHRLAVGEVENVAEFTADCLCIAGPGAWPKRHDQVDVLQLPNQPFVAVTGAIQKRLEALLKDAGGELHILAETSQSLIASELVMRGLGISVVDPFTGAMHRRRGGAALPLQPALPFSVQAMALGDTRLNAPARDLLKYLAAATEEARNASAA